MSSDAELVRRCRDGDQGAWGEFVNGYSRYVYSICSRGFRLRDADAEDVFQEVFARAYQHLHTLRDEGAIRPWIAQTTRRLAIDVIRSQERVDLRDEFPDQASSDRVMEDLAEAMTVQDALGGLSEPCQEILDRFYVRDQTRKVISAELGIPDGTIASRISRCLEKLKDALGPSIPQATVGEA